MLRTISVIEVHCTSCGWISRLKESEPVPSKCPACSVGKDSWLSNKPKKWPDKITHQFVPDKFGHDECCYSADGFGEYFCDRPKSEHAD